MAEVVKMTEKKYLQIALCAPYLIDDLPHYGKNHERAEGNTFLDFKNSNMLRTRKHNIFFNMLNAGDFQIYFLSELKLRDLVILGNMEDAEERAMKLRGSGVIVARYSIFYGGKNKYTGNSPEKAGYSLDIPKKFKTVKALLKNDEFLEALVTREEKQFKKAIQEFNKEQDQPVLITPYLREALKVKHET